MFAFDDFAYFKENNEQKCPERVLISAVLKRAMLDYLKGDAIDSVDARSWFFDSSGDEREAFSFSWICAQLDLNNELLLERLAHARPEIGAPLTMHSAAQRENQAAAARVHATSLSAGPGPTSAAPAC